MVDYREVGFTLYQLLFDDIDYNLSAIYDPSTTVYQQQLVSHSEFHTTGSNSTEKSDAIYIEFFKGLKSAGYKPNEFKAQTNPNTPDPNYSNIFLNFSTEVLKETGFSASDLNNPDYGGYGIDFIYDSANRNNYRNIEPYSCADMKNAGYTILDLGKRGVGFTIQDLNENAGFTATQMRNTGIYTLEELKFGHNGLGGYDVTDLKNAGYTALQLRNAGFTAAEMRYATPPFSVRELTAAGYTAGELTSILQADELRTYGYTVRDLLAEGFDGKRIQEAGYTLQEMADAAFDYNELRTGSYEVKTNHINIDKIYEDASSCSNHGLVENQEVLQKYK